MLDFATALQAVETQLLQQTGVTSAMVNLVTETATIECRADVNPVQLANHLSTAGFPSQVQHSKANSNPEVKTSVRWTLIGFFILVVCFNLCLNAQVLTVGLAYFYNSE